MQKEFNLLVVDRNPHIRNFLKREMQAEGYHVQLARNAREVLSIIFGPEPIDLIIIDLDLPGANEVNLLKCLEDRDPPLPFIIHGDLFSYVGSTSPVSKVVFVQKQGNSSETLKDVVLNLLKGYYIKKL